MSTGSATRPGGPGRDRQSEGGQTDYHGHRDDLVHAVVRPGPRHGPPRPADVQLAAAVLCYRDFLTVALVVPAATVAWNDNWIYIHDAGVRTMRIQNFGSWSLLVKDGRNVLGLEYTVDEGEVVDLPDEELIELGKRTGPVRAVEPPT